MFFNFPLDEIDATVLERLKADSVREDRQLEYKEMLPGGSDEEKREFLSDVTGLANAAGGDLIYGVRERRDEGAPTSTIESKYALSPQHRSSYLRPSPIKR
jgi:predicted HTH transcriptional regulator